jgi:hypothetical protein
LQSAELTNWQRTCPPAEASTFHSETDERKKGELKDLLLKFCALFSPLKHNGYYIYRLL